jgi:hypothetical protein
MNPFTESFDLGDVLQRILGATLESRGFSARQDLNTFDEKVFENAHCRLKFANRDNRFVGFEFQNTKDSVDQWYALLYFLPINPGACDVPGEPLDNLDSPSLSYFESWVIYFKNVLEHCLKGPIAGDFTWVDHYKQFKAQSQKMDQFLADQVWTRNVKAKAIVRKQGMKDPTWESDARALYKEVNGKEFE